MVNYQRLFYYVQKVNKFNIIFIYLNKFRYVNHVSLYKHKLLFSFTPSARKNFSSGVDFLPYKKLRRSRHILSG
jgi:hypothetical protein